MPQLSLADVIQLKNNPSRESRLLVAEKMCDQFNGRTFTEEEHIIVTEIFRLLAKDTEVAIRHAMAEKLKHNARLPQDVAMTLASDVLQVALPVLQFSPVLTEADLLLLTRNATEITRLLAISKRDIVTPRISKELIAKSQIVLTESLLKNKGAVIALEDSELVLTRYGSEQSILAALVARDFLPTGFVEQLLHQVTGELKQKLIAKHRDYIHAIHESADEAHETVLMQQVAAPAKSAQKQALVDHLHRSQKLNSSLVVRAVCIGDIEFFINSMEKLTQWKRERILQAIDHKNIDQLRHLYRAAGLPESIQDATLAVLVLALEEIKHGQKAGSSSFAGRMIERVVSNGYDRSVNNMRYLLTLIGKKPAHLILEGQ